MFSNRAQGTIEYLVVVAVVIVISLVVVGLMTNILSDSGGSVTANSGQLNNMLGSGGLVISDAVVDSSGNAIVSVNNSSGDILTVTGVNTDTGGTTPPVNVVPGDTTNLNFDNLNFNDLCVCSAGQTSKTCTFSIQVTRPSGITETFNRTITVQCITNSALRLLHDPAYGTTITGQLIPASGTIGHSLVNSSGTAISTQAQLDAALASGDLNIYVVSTSGLTSTRPIASIPQYNNPLYRQIAIGCLGYTYKDLADPNGTHPTMDYSARGADSASVQGLEFFAADTNYFFGGFGEAMESLFEGRFAKVTGVNGDEANFPGVLNSTYKINTYKLGRCAHNFYFDWDKSCSQSEIIMCKTCRSTTDGSTYSYVALDLEGLKNKDGTSVGDICTSIYNAGYWYNGREFRDWTIGIYDYNVTLGSSSAVPTNGQIIVDPIAGSIHGKTRTGLTLTNLVSGYLDCSDTNRTVFPFVTKKCCTGSNCCASYSGGVNCTVDLDNNCSALTCNGDTCTKTPSYTGAYYVFRCNNKAASIENISLDSRQPAS